MAKADPTKELTGAIARIWAPRLAPLDFRRVGRRDLAVVNDGILGLFNFQLSAHGSKHFYVNVAAFTISGHDGPVLQPGFRLRSPKGDGALFPSLTKAQAEASAEVAWTSATEQALPWLTQNASLAGHLTILNAEVWRARHHLQFQIGVTKALMGKTRDATEHLRAAVTLYVEAGYDWAARYIAKSEALIAAISRNEGEALLREWYTANLPVHRLKESH